MGQRHGGAQHLPFASVAGQFVCQKTGSLQGAFDIALATIGGEQCSGEEGTGEGVEDEGCPELRLVLGSKSIVVDRMECGLEGKGESADVGTIFAKGEPRREPDGTVPWTIVQLKKIGGRHRKTFGIVQCGVALGVERIQFDGGVRNRTVQPFGFDTGQKCIEACSEAHLKERERNGLGKTVQCGMETGAQIDMTRLFDSTFGGMVVLVATVHLEGMGAVGSQGELHFLFCGTGERYSRATRGEPHGCGDGWSIFIFCRRGAVRTGRRQFRQFAQQGR